MERGISVDAVKTAIRQPDNIIRLVDGEIKSMKRLEKGTLVVVHKKEKGLFVIITAYFK